MADEVLSPQSFRHSRFLEDRAVGGKAPSSNDQDDTPILSKVARYLSSFNPFSTIRGFSQPAQAVQPLQQTGSTTTLHSRPESRYSTAPRPRRPKSSLSLFPADGTPPGTPDSHTRRMRRRHSLASLRKTPSTISLAARTQIDHASKSLKRRLSVANLEKHRKRETKLAHRVDVLEAQLESARRDLRACTAPRQQGRPLTPFWTTELEGMEEEGRYAERVERRARDDELVRDEDGMRAAEGQMGRSPVAARSPAAGGSPRRKRKQLREENTPSKRRRTAEGLGAIAEEDGFRWPEDCF